MMNVQRMRRIVDVVDGGGLPRIAYDAAQRWHGESLTYVRTSGNHIFRLVLPDGAIGYLRLTPAAERSLDSLRAEVDFVQHVAHSGAAVARPFPSEAETFIEEIDDRGNPPSEAQSYHAIVFEGLHGRQMEHDELDEPHYRAWGRALAQLHRASQTFPLHPERASWLDEIRSVRASLPSTERVVAQVLEAGAAWLETLPVQPGEFGLLHGDCELDNLVWNGQHPQMLDFDSAMYAPYLVDVAIALHEVWSAESPNRDDHIAWFCDGYRELRPLPANFLELLPRLLTLLVAFKVAQLLQAYTPTTTDREGCETAADPPWLVTMRARHHRWLDAQRAVLTWT